MRQEVIGRDIPVLVYEGGEALRFNEISIRAGVNGILAVMHHLGMLKKEPNIKTASSYIAKSSYWVRAAGSGLFRSKKKLGARVKENEILGFIADPFGKHEIKVTSAAEGIVIGKTELPLIDEGDALYHIATFKKSQSVVETLTEFREDLGEASIYRNANI